MYSHLYDKLFQHRPMYSVNLARSFALAEADNLRSLPFHGGQKEENMADRYIIVRTIVLKVFLRHKL